MKLKPQTIYVGVSRVTELQVDDRFVEKQEGRIVLTVEDFKEHIRDAFNAGSNYQHQSDFGKVPNVCPSNDEYINSIIP